MYAELDATSTMTLPGFMTLENSSFIYTVPSALTRTIVSGSAMAGESPAELMTFFTSPRDAANSASAFTLSRLDVSHTLA